MASPRPSIEELSDRHWRELRGMLLAITRNATLAEDLAQEVFVVALRKGMEPGPETRLWLREVARRLAIAELRRRRPKTMGDFEQFIESIHPPEASAPAAESAEFNEEVTALRACVKALPEGLREIVALKYEKEQPLSKLAAHTGKTVGYLKQVLFRLRKRLADCIRRRLATGVSHG
ncbi:MAG: sigma-70 family RNA polymerase sigma factor [Planctomycetota bacterium]